MAVIVYTVLYLIFILCFEGPGKSSNNLSPGQGGAEVSVILLLTKYPVSSVAPCQGRGISFDRFPRLWQTVLHLKLLLFVISELVYPVVKVKEVGGPYMS